MTTTMLLLIVAAVAIGCGVAWYVQTRQRSAHLRERFGPEYERTRSQVGDMRRAEAALAAREQRVGKLHIRSLAPDERARFAEVWHHIQSLFVDDPQGAIGEADRLVNDVMTTRGYPVADFEQRTADISVDHPVVVEHYRAAGSIAERNESGVASTEDLRQAVIHYRALFDDLLEQKPTDVKHTFARR
jgi:hypothetical protein